MPTNSRAPGRSGTLSQMFKNMNVGRKLGALIGVAAVALSCVGLIGIKALDKVNSDAQDIYSEGAIPLQELAEVRYDVNNGRISLLKHGIAETADKRAEYQAKLPEIDIAVDKSFAVYEGS